jgi:hypothetical protein
MRNRKITLVAFMLVAVLMLGIGYAALTDTLTIIGNAHIDFAQAEVNYDGKIFFSAATAVSSTGTGATADTASFSADDANFTANKLATKDEYSVFKFTVTNNSNVNVKVIVNPTKLSGAENPSNSNAAKFSVTYEYSEDDKIIDAGQTMDITVTVKVIAPITEATSATFGIEYVVETVA